VKSQRQNLKWISADRSIIFAHVVEERVLVREMVVRFHFCIDAPLVGDVGFLLREDVELDIFFRLISLSVIDHYFELSQHLEMLLLLPLREDEVVFSKVFSQQTRRLPRLRDRLAVFIQDGF
jgi:hypothetical protein